MAAPTGMQALYEQFAEGSDQVFGTVIAPCLHAMQNPVWTHVTEHTKEEFFRLGPLTDCVADGVPHEGGYHVQPCMVEHLVKVFLAEKGTSSNGFLKEWFPPSSYCRTPSNKNPATECAKGFRRAMPVSRLVCRILLYSRITVHIC
jgi:hypothetical protein